jgi:hypothetical protein
MSWNNSYRERHSLISVSFNETGAKEAVTLREVKDYCRITGSDEDGMLSMMITACRRELEQYLGLSIVQKEITIEADLGHEWELPYGPVMTIDSVSRRTGTDVDGLGEYETVEAENYFKQGNLFDPGYGRHVIVYTAGFLPNDEQTVYGYSPPVYGSGYFVLPQDIKLQLLRLIAYRYEHRGDVEQVSISKIVGTANKNFSWI